MAPSFSVMKRLPLFIQLQSSRAETPTLPPFSLTPTGVITPDRLAGFSNSLGTLGWAACELFTVVYCMVRKSPV